MASSSSAGMQVAQWPVGYTSYLIVGNVRTSCGRARRLYSIGKHRYCHMQHLPSEAGRQHHVCLG